MERVPDRTSHEAAAVETSGEDDRLETLIAAFEPLPPAPEVRATYGTVDGMEGDAVVVRVSGRLVKARRAVSCLVDPGVGDRVLVAFPSAAESYADVSDESFVLAVLVKGECRAPGHDGGHPYAPGLTLSVDGDVTLRSRGGTLALVANKAVSIASAAKIELNAPELEVRAMKTSFFSASLSYLGRALHGEIDTIKLAAGTIDRVVDRLTERIQQSFRTVEQIERVKAGELDIDVEGGISIHSDNTILTAEKLVKVDGEQIHLG